MNQTVRPPPRELIAGSIVASSERYEKAEISSCLEDILYVVKRATRGAVRAGVETVCSTNPEVLSYEYDKATKERKVEEETADTWDGACTTELHCETCGESHNDIIERGPSASGWRIDSLSVFIPDISTECLLSGSRPKECYAVVMCQSCLQDKEQSEEVEDGYGERCSACGISNLLCCDEDIVEDYFHYNIYRDFGLCGFCPSCSEHLSEQEKAEKLYDRRERLSIPHNQDYEDHCHLPAIDDEEHSDDDIELTDSDEEDLIYDPQYENEELPENNTEKAKKIKGAVREVGEKIFDIQDKLKEGEYLEIMNLLQKVTNEVNSL